MIKAMELLSILYDHHILNILYDTNSRCITTWICTDGANVCIADIMTGVTVSYLMFQTMDSLSELFYVSILLTEHLQNGYQGEIIVCCFTESDAKYYQL